MKKDKKTEILKTRISVAEKQMIFQYCEKHNITVSDFIRSTLLKFVKED